MDNYEHKDAKQQRKKGNNGMVLHVEEKRHIKSGKDNSRHQGRGADRLFARGNIVQTVDPVASWHEFADAPLSGMLKGEGKRITFDSRIYLQPVAKPALDGLRVDSDAEDNNCSEDIRKGYVLVCTDSYPIGWRKYTAGGMLKNELSTGWRFI